MDSYSLAANYILSLFTALTIAIFVQTILKHKLKTRPVVLFIVVLGFVKTLEASLMGSAGTAIGFPFIFLITVLLLKFFLKTKFNEGFIIYGIFCILQALGIVLVSLIFLVYGLDYAAIQSNSTLMIYSKVLIVSFNLIICALIKLLGISLTFPVKENTKGSVFFITLSLAIIIVNFKFYHRTYQFTSNRFELAITAALFLMYFIYCLINTTVFLRLGLKEQELESQVLYNEALDKLISDFRRFRHNYNNMLGVMAGYLETDSTEALKAYCSELVQQNESLKNYANYTLLNIKEAGMQGLIKSKISYAERCGVKLIISVTGEIKEVNMRISELCEILGIFLDNAIEAASESTGRAVHLYITNREDTVNFLIRNTTGTSPHLGDIYKRGYSTKGRGRGLGLWIARNITQKYKHVLLNTSVEDYVFVQELIILHEGHMPKVLGT